MQNKTNKNKVVLVVGHQHSETVMVDIFNKYMPELLKKYKVSFLDEIKKETLETSIIGNLTLSLKDYEDFNAKVSEVIKKRDIVSSKALLLVRDDASKQKTFEQMKKLQKLCGFKIDSTENFEALKKALQNRDENAAIQFIDQEKVKTSLQLFTSFGKVNEYNELFSQRLVDIVGDDYNTEYNQMIKKYQQNPAIKYQFIDQDDLVMVLVLGSLKERNESMSVNILKHIKDNPEQELFIVSVGSDHVPEITKILSEAPLSNSCRVIPVLDTDGSVNAITISPEKYVSKVIQDVFPRIKEEQDKDEMKFIDGLLKGLMFLSGKDEVSLIDYTMKQFKCSSKDEAIEKVKALAPLKKENSIVRHYDGQTKTFTITYPNVMQEEINDIFPQQPQSFTKLVEQQSKKEQGIAIPL